MAERGLPTNTDAERFVLGSIMLNSAKHYDTVTSRLSEEHFSLKSHRLILKRMAALRDRGEHIDRITVANELMSNSELEAVGGLSYLVSLDDGLPELISVDSYVTVVLEKAALRRLVNLGQHTMNLAFAETTQSSVIMDRLGKKITQMQVQGGDKSTLLRPLDIMEAFPGGTPAFLLNSIKPGIPTGYQGIDDLVMGFHKGSQYVIAGSTGSGKSVLSSNIAVNIAKQGRPVAIFSLEMSKELLLGRAICAEAAVPLKGYIRGNLMSDQRKAVTEAAYKISELPLLIDDFAGLTISQLYARVGRAVAEHKIEVFVLDYLQILDYQAEKTMKFRNEYDAVTYASRTCRLLARNHNVASIVVSQLSRPADKRKLSEKPNLTDLRASGGIEQDAVAVMMIYRPELYTPGKEELRGKAEILIRKSRMGEPGTVNLLFEGKYVRFRETEETLASEDN